jgi:hypothetical protein
MQHTSVKPDRLLVIYCNPLLGDVFDKHPAFERFYAGRHALLQGDLANFGETENSFVIWKGKSDSLSVPYPGANAVIRTHASHAEVEA